MPDVTCTSILSAAASAATTIVAQTASLVRTARAVAAAGNPRPISPIVRRPAPLPARTARLEAVPAVAAARLAVPARPLEQQPSAGRVVIVVLCCRATACRAGFADRVVGAVADVVWVDVERQLGRVYRHDAEFAARLFGRVTGRGGGG